MKIAIATTFAALLAATSFAYADDSGKKMNDTTTGSMTDDATTGSIKCDNSNANVNSGCDKPGHMKQEERMDQNDTQQ